MFCFCKLLIYNLNLVGHTSCEIYTEAAVLTPAAHCDSGLQQKPSFTLLSSVIDGREPECLKDEKAFKIICHITTLFLT